MDSCSSPTLCMLHSRLSTGGRRVTSRTCSSDGNGWVNSYSVWIRSSRHHIPVVAKMKNMQKLAMVKQWLEDDEPLLNCKKKKKCWKFWSIEMIKLLLNQSRESDECINVKHYCWMLIQFIFTAVFMKARFHGWTLMGCVKPTSC